MGGRVSAADYRRPDAQTTEQPQRFTNGLDSLVIR